jgi:capsular polysaccharide biosynthesis protein
MDKNISKVNTDDGIELIELFNKIKANYKVIVNCLIVAFVIALLIIILTPKQYKTQISLLSESNSKSSAGGLLGQLGGLSGLSMDNLIGMDLGGGLGKDALTPDLYPDIVRSTTFLMEILSARILEPKSDKEITVAQYLNDFSKPSILGIPSYLLNKIKSKNNDSELFSDQNFNSPLNLTQQQSDLIKSLSEIINIKVIKSGGGLTGGGNKIIKISVEVQNPIVSASLAILVEKNLKEYIINYNTNKVKKDLKFIEARYLEAQKRYYQAQKILADYDDSHTNTILASVKTNRKRLETENNLAAGIYKGLAQKLEQAKILVQDKTPVFTVIEPAKIPLRKSKPKRIFIMISFLFIGIFAGITIIFSKGFIKSFNLKPNFRKSESHSVSN